MIIPFYHDFSWAAGEAQAAVLLESSRCEVKPAAGNTTAIQSRESGMKKNYIALQILIISMFAFAVQCFASEGKQTSVEIVFCKTLNDNLEPSEIVSVFDSNIISWRMQREKPFGMHQVILSIYQRQGSQEKVVERQTLEIRPSWNIYGIRNMKLPAEGEYILSVEGKDGAVLGEGKVTVGKLKKDASEVKTETLGATLGKLFEKYAPKK
ncbi:MAG: hypothetical protein LBR82_01865 [Desulfovibrio sp.]|jgi:hypothetical protein|nr:hypothetical protein [Desulfovibrio sp.]